jgi:hypothetical protein
MELTMQVEICIKVDGRVVKTHVQQVEGTLENMEETIHALGKRVAGDTFQASVNAVTGPRPLFRKTEESGGIAGTKVARLSDSMGS